MLGIDFPAWLLWGSPMNISATPHPCYEIKLNNLNGSRGWGLVELNFSLSLGPYEEWVDVDTLPQGGDFCNTT